MSLLPRGYRIQYSYLLAAPFAAAVVAVYCKPNSIVVVKKMAMSSWISPLFIASRTYSLNFNTASILAVPYEVVSCCAGMTSHSC